jgi:hypothetical protein
MVLFNKTIHLEGCVIVTEVMEKCDEEARDNSLLFLSKQATKRNCGIHRCGDDNNKENEKRKQSEEHRMLR